MSGPFDGTRNPTPLPPPPRDAGDSGNWYAAHRELGERLGGRIERVEERLDEDRDGDIVAHGLDGRDGKLAVVAKDVADLGTLRDKDSTQTRWLLGILASVLIAGGGFVAGAWARLGDRVTTVDVRAATHEVRLDALTEQLRHQEALLEALVPRRDP